MHKYFRFCLLPLFIVLSSCTGRPPVTTPGPPNNSAEYVVPTYTPRSIPTPLPKSESGEFTLLLRKRITPYEAVILRLPSECLLGREACDLNGNLLGALPQSLSQILKIYWTNNGDKAFFWDDNTTNVYILDGNQGTFQVFKKEVLKVRDDFLISPNGENTIFEIQKNDYETDLVLMNNSSGDIFKLDVPVPGAKYASQWIDDTTVLFWSEISEGKGYLVDLKVYTLDVTNQSVQPFDIGRDWMKTSVPVFSPNRKRMMFTSAGETIVRDVSDGAENVINVEPENFLWFPNSESLVIYDQNKDLLTARYDGNETEILFSLPENEHLQDWIWLLDNTHLFLITTDEDGNKQIGVLSVADKTFTPLNLPLLNEYDPISFSFRP
jgi:hypothetical protein